MEYMDVDMEYMDVDVNVEQMDHKFQKNLF